MGRLLFFVIGIIAAIYLSTTLLWTTTLGEGEIEDLFEQRTALHNNLTSDKEAVVNFIAYNMTTDFTYTSANTLHMPGQEPRPVRTNMDKRGYGAYLVGTMGQMTQYTYSHEIQNIEIDENGRQATVAYTMTTNAVQDGGQDTRITGDCTASLYLDRNDTLRFSRIDCEGDMYVTSNAAKPPAPPPPAE